jgi:hypothetical protein
MGKDRPNKREYLRILEALKLLVGAVITLTVSRKDGKRKKTTFVANILSAGHWDDDNDQDKGEVLIAVNPYFYELYAKGGMTLLDVHQRSEIRTQIAKALFRFVQSQNKLLPMHYLTIAAAINLDLEQPAKQTRRQLKSAISELVKHNTLDMASGFQSQDIVKLVKSPQSRTRHKLLPPGGA